LSAAHGDAFDRKMRTLNQQETNQQKTEMKTEMNTHKKTGTAALLAAALTLTAGVAPAAFAAESGWSILNDLNIAMAMTPVGNAGNTADETGYGKVNYDYYIGTYEVTNAQYAAFLNAVASTADNHGLYDSKMGSDQSHGGIEASTGNTGEVIVTTYAVKPGFDNKPVNFVTFQDAVRFANWLGTGETENGVYTLTPDGITSNSITRNQDVWTGNAGYYAIASENEWYKAAYYDPTRDETGGYWLYPTRNDTISYTTDAADGVNLSLRAPGESVELTEAGSYIHASSYFGTYDQGGNVWEWNETISDTNRGLRGGAYSSEDVLEAASSTHGIISSGFANSSIGFRVVAFSLPSVPEPGAVAGAMGLAVLAVGVWRRRGRHHRHHRHRHAVVAAVTARAASRCV
jgi:formylglycine-generating enzyme required for sulfatase activity